MGSAFSWTSAKLQVYRYRRWFSLVSPCSYHACVLLCMPPFHDARSHAFHTQTCRTILVVKMQVYFFPPTHKLVLSMNALQNL